MAILTHFFLLDSITDLILTITFTMRTDDASMTFYELPVCLLPYSFVYPVYGGALLILYRTL